MNSEEVMVLQMSLRDIMFAVVSNKGVMNLQKILPELERYQTRVNHMLKDDRVMLANIINHMSID